MLKSLDDHNGHLRKLVDQRNARADLHGRLSAAGSEYSDPPSVYSSRSYFSSRPSQDDSHHIGYVYSTSSEADDRATARYSHTTMLDLDAERRTSYASKDPSYIYEGDDEETETVARMSYLGPKMRFHSRAPWEEDPLEEEEEGDFPTNRLFSRKNFTKGIGSGLSSPRPSFAGSESRPSEDSSISQPPSFETVNSQLSSTHSRGGIYALAQESVSTTSLAQPTTLKEGLQNKLSISRLRTESFTTPNTPPIPSPMASLANNYIPGSPSSPTIGDFSTSLRSSPDSELPSTSKTSIHPYANPDLVISYGQGGTRETPARSVINYALTHNDSKRTLTESSPIDSMTRSTTHANIITTDSSSKVRTSPINTKCISSPVSVISSPLHVNSADRNISVQGLPGWTERSSSAQLTLISLEEARAKRMRSSVDTGAAHLPPSDLGMPFPGGSNDYPSSSSSSPLSNLASRSRGRSISAGAKAKNALQTIVGQPKLERRDSEPVLKDEPSPGPPPGKILKNKKSGIMRLFNKDRDNYHNPPPVPSLPEGINQVQITHRSVVSNVHRAPVPSLVRVERSVSETSETLHANKGMKYSVLSIDTSTQSPPPHGVLSDRPNTTLNVPSNVELQSAPPHLLEFPTLKLRPVSTQFSASFADLVPSDCHAVDEPPDPGTPRSPSPTLLTSPTTPLSLSRPDHLVASVDVEDHLAFKTLQEQMSTTKNAWQRHIWDLEGQLRDLKAELEELKQNDGYCDKCGRGKKSHQDFDNKSRARAESFRFVNSRP